MIKSVCVFCGSSSGKDPAYSEAAGIIGTIAAESKIRLVYGGGNAGLMNSVSEAAMRRGGEVTGVITNFFKDAGLAKKEITHMYFARTMHERKFKMAELADAFIALPGGIGTVEELSEALTWNQLHIHQKPCAILNTLGYFDKFIDFLKKTEEEGFYNFSEHPVIIDKDPYSLFSRLTSCDPSGRPDTSHAE